MVEIKLFGYVADFMGMRTKCVNIDSPIPLKELLLSPFPETNIIILINEKAGNLDSIINDEDSIIISPIFSGG